MFKKKTAICFAGQARGIEYVYENLKENLIRPFENCDIFVYVAEDENSNKILKYFENTKELTITKDPIINEMGINSSQRSLQEYLRMNWSRKMVNKMRRDFEKRNNFKYDIVIHSRLDIKFGTSLSLFKIDQLDMNYLYIPDFHNYPCVQGYGYNDRFAISNSDNMNIFLNLFDYIREDSNLGNTVHGEPTLYRYLIKNNILVKKIPFRFCRVGKDGKERDGHIIIKDKSQWQFIERD